MLSPCWYAYHLRRTVTSVTARSGSEVRSEGHANTTCLLIPSSGWSGWRTASWTESATDWNKPFPAHKVIGNVYYVGSEQLASFLITTPDGHILVNSSFETTVPVISAAVEKLGFTFTDIKILVGSHAHGITWKAMRSSSS